MGVVDEFPFPFQQPMAQELLRLLAAQYRSERDAFAFVETVGIDVLELTQGLSPLNLWHQIVAGKPPVSKNEGIRISRVRAGMAAKQVTL